METQTVRAKIQRVEDLIVWKKAHRLVLAVYTATRAFPKDERYGIVSQIRRAAASVPANIAEGFRKRTKTEKQRFVTIAHGSLEETRYFLILSRDLGYCEVSEMLSLSDEVSKLLALYYKKMAGAQ
ncbi:MAG: four helix bundle protein [Phycisphaerae bacterium]|nr:four helix bundle protein [Phycisphaerae bacterium]